MNSIGFRKVVMLKLTLSIAVAAATLWSAQSASAQSGFVRITDQANGDPAADHSLEAQAPANGMPGMASPGPYGGGVGSPWSNPFWNQSFDPLRPGRPPVPYPMSPYGYAKPPQYPGRPGVWPWFVPGSNPYAPHNFPRPKYPPGLNAERQVRGGAMVGIMAATFPLRKAYEYLGGPKVGKGGPIDIMLSDDLRTTLPPDYGWTRPTKTPIQTIPASHYSAWVPEKPWGSYTPGADIKRYPIVSQPTDTTQLGYYYQHVPSWQPNPGMLPPAPFPPHWQTREQQYGIQPSLFFMKPWDYHKHAFMYNNYGKPFPASYGWGPVITETGPVPQMVSPASAETGDDE